MFFCDECEGDLHHEQWCPLSPWRVEPETWASDETIAKLRAKLTKTLERPEGSGDVTFTRLDGKTVKIGDVDYDSISGNGSGRNVIAVNKFDSDEIIHVPFVAYWTISY